MRSLQRSHPEQAVGYLRRGRFCSLGRAAGRVAVDGPEESA